MSSRRGFPITPDLVLRAYAAGLFPMAEGRGSGRLFWLDPEHRGVIPLDGFRVSRSLARAVLSNRFEVSADRDFAATIAGCAAPAPGREDSWINPEIEALFNALHRMGHAHSIEVRSGGELVGGLYGVRLGGAFFGESMFSRRTDASKVALTHLVVRLRMGGFTLLDTQFLTDHLARLGAVEIPQNEYKARLRAACDTAAEWIAEPDQAAFEAGVRSLRAAASGSGD